MPKKIRIDGEDTEHVKYQLSKLSVKERENIITKAKAELARSDFTMYNEFVHNWKLAPHHIEWGKTFSEQERGGIIAPPESGKSRIMRSWLEWEIGRNNDIAELLVQNTQSQSGSQVAAIAGVVTSDRYKLVFPDVMATDRWSSEKIFIKRETQRPDATLAGYGVTGPYQGAHVDVLIIDDPTDQNDVLSPSMMQKQRDQIKGVLIDRLNLGGKMFVILTRWSDYDLVPTLEELDVPMIAYPAMKSEPYAWGSKLLYEAQYNEDRLDVLKRQKGQDLFKLTYLCEAAGAVRGYRIFRDKMDEYMHMHDMSGFMRENTEVRYVKNALGVDFGTTTAHKSAMVLASLTNAGVVVVRAAWSSSTGSSMEIIEKAKDWKHEYNVRNAYVDPQQSSLIDMFKHMAGYDGWKGHRWVEERISALLTLLSTDNFVMDREGPGIMELWSQLQSYSKDEGGHVIEKNDDLVDALLYALMALQAPATSGIGPQVEIRNPKANRDPSDPFATDAYHDYFNPAKWIDNTGSNDFSKKMRNYGNV